MEPSNKEYKGNNATNGAFQTMIDGIRVNLIPTWSKHTKAIILTLVIFTTIAIPAITVPVYLKAHPSPDTAPSVTSSKTSSASKTVFTTSTSPSVSTTARASSTATLLPPPPKPTADGVRLVNSLKGGTKAREGSGYAYFISAVNGNHGAQPDDYAVATTNVYAHWENQNRTVLFGDTNTTFRVNINSTGAPVNAAVGEASNGFRTFICYKDDGGVLFKQNGSVFFGAYYCQ
ncbi:MAG: hypothetical protein M1812_006933 [Candelaria pacifica]|nr:MAG: hypothetical protein M1812_006933 [Candelaria pacifica]